MPESAASLDQFLRRLGEPGRYQALVGVLVCFNYVPIALSQTLMTFYGYTPPHNCRLPERWAPETSLPSTGPADAPVFDQCRMYVEPANHSWGTKDCIYGYQFHVQKLEWTSVTEWGLVCDRRYLAQLITTLYLVGAMLGGLAFGTLSDRFGRQPVMLLCLYTQLILGVGLFFVRRLVIFIGLRTLQGFFVQGLECTSLSLLVELVPIEYHPAVVVAGQVCWGLGLLLLTACQFFVRHWRYVQLAISIPSLVTLLYIWLIPESLPWLVTQRLRRRARGVVFRSARYNGLRVTTELLAQLDKVCLTTADGGTATAEGKPAPAERENRRRHTVILMIVWLCFSVSVAGVSSRPLQLGGADRFAQRALEAAVHVAGALLAYPAVRRAGRRSSLAASLVLTGTLLVVTVAAERFLNAAVVDVPAMVTSLLLVSRAAAVGSRCCLLLSTAELAPTVLRALLLGGCLLMNEAGRLLTPRLLLLMANSPEWVPLVVFGCLSIAAGLFALLLPGTLQRTLPNTRHHSDTEQQSVVDTEQRYQAADRQRHLSSSRQRHLQPASQVVTPSAQLDDGLLSPSAAEQGDMRRDVSAAIEPDAFRQVREHQTYRATPSTRAGSGHQRSGRPTVVTPAASSVCSCYSHTGGAAPVLLMGDNVTMMPRYGSTANTLYSYGQFCPYCVNSLQRNGAAFRGEQSGAAGMQGGETVQPPREEAGGDSAPVSYDVPPRTRRVPWWKRGADAGTRSRVERCVVDGRIVTRRSEGDGGSFMPRVPQEEDGGVQEEVRDSISPNRSPVNSAEAAEPKEARLEGAQTVGAHGMFRSPVQMSQPDDIRERDSRPGPIADGKTERRRGLEARGRRNERGTVRNVGSRTDTAAVRRPQERSRDLVRLVIARV